MFRMRPINSSFHYSYHTHKASCRSVSVWLTGVSHPDHGCLREEGAVSMIQKETSYIVDPGIQCSSMMGGFTRIQMKAGIQQSSTPKSAPTHSRRENVHLRHIWEAPRSCLPKSQFKSGANQIKHSATSLTRKKRFHLKYKILSPILF